MGSIGGESPVTPEKVRAMQRTAKTIEPNTREGYQFRESIQDAIRRTDDETLLRQLRKLLDDLNNTL